MSPKPPLSTHLPKVDLPTPSSGQLPRSRPNAEAPLVHPPSTSRIRQPQGQPLHPDNSEPSRSGSSEHDPDTSGLAIGDSSSGVPVVRETSPDLRSYLLKPAMLRAMQPANEEGIRYVVGRKFVDVKDAGTVYVEFDASLGTYRAADLYKKLPNGPALYKNADGLTWSPLPPVMTETPIPLKRSGSDAEFEASGPVKRAKDSSSETAQASPLPASNTRLGTQYPLNSPDAMGYYRIPLETAPNANAPAYLYGYTSRDGLWTVVDAPPQQYLDKPNDSSHGWLDAGFHFFSITNHDAQGYHRISLKPGAGATEPGYVYFFETSGGFWVKVDSPPAGVNADPVHLKHWKDREIWQAYGLQGADITRFRAEAEASGAKPQWVTTRQSERPRIDLLNDALRWVYPDKSLEERADILRSYNLSPAQLTRLRNEMISEQKIPQWAVQHQAKSLDVNDPSRFDQLHEEIEPLILPLRNGTLQGNPLGDFEESISKDFLRAFLAKLGYLRNKNDCLYRLDIPGLFRADERSPFELANDGFMLPRMKHAPGAATKKPMSATISMTEVRKYGGGSPDPEYLTYNRQINKYPGKVRDSSDDSSNDSNSSDSSESSENEWSDTPPPLDLEKNYTAERHKQSFQFTYVIDTRNLEVVLGEENLYFNGSAQKDGIWFPTDDLEALISASQRGISSDRIWLFNSSLTRAAKIEDVAARFANSPFGNVIAERTRMGIYNRDDYDGLIEDAAEQGKPILERTTAADWFADDIVWPE